MKIKIILLIVLFLLCSQIPAVIASHIIVENAASVWDTTPEHSSGLTNTASGVTPRVKAENANSLSQHNLQDSENLNQVASAVLPRIIVEYANSIIIHTLISPEFISFDSPEDEPAPQEDNVEEDLDKNIQDLIKDYAPVLYVHQDADYNCPINISQFLYNSNLRDKNTKAFLIKNPSIEDLMTYSGDNYYLDEIVIDSEENPNLNEDATVYVHYYENNNLYFLQYWFFYYYNNGINIHEGDWEMIQLSFDSNFNPLKATYSQHEYWFFNWGEKRKWKHVEKHIDGDRLTNHPIVYVSSGTGLNKLANSHANYFYRGDSPETDYTNECSYLINPQDYELVCLPYHEDQNFNSYGWLQFEGNWGECGLRPDFFEGPHGPAFRTFNNGNDDLKMWEKPYEFETGRSDDGYHKGMVYGIFWNEGFEYPTIEISDKSCKIGNTVLIDAYLKDNDGNPIAGENVDFFVDKKLVGSWSTEYNGRAFYKYRDTNNAGVYKIEAVFKGQNEDENSKYAWCDNEAVLTIGTDLKDIDEDSKDKGIPATSTPGFQLIFVICAVAMVLFWKRKRKI